MAVTEHIWKEFHERLFGFIKKRVSNEELAKDLLQEVFIKIHQKIETIHDEKRISSWVYQITRNTIIDYYRKKKEITSELPQNIALPEDFSATSIDFTNCLLPFVDQLNEKDRDVIKKVLFDKVSQKEYAQQNNMPYSSVKSRLQRARLKLKELFVNCCNIQFDAYGNIVSHQSDNCDC